MKKISKKHLYKIPKLLELIICVILTPIIAMNVTIVIKSYIIPDKVADFFGIKPFVVVTDSMKNVFSGGDLVVTKTFDPAALHVGDIISYKEGGSVITHRIIGLTEKDGQTAFITKGDANNAEDAKVVTYSQVEGIYLFRLQKIGHLAMFMQTPMGMLVFICIPVFGFTLYDMIRRRLDARKYEQFDKPEIE